MRVRAIAVGLFLVLYLCALPASAQLMSGGWPKFQCDIASTGLSSASGPAGSLAGWDYLTGGAVTGDPVIDSNGNIYFVSGDTYLYSLGPDGTLRWQYPLHSTGRGAPAIASNGTIYAGSSLSYLYAFSPTGTLKMRKLLGGALGSSPGIGADGTVYAPCTDKKLYAFTSTGDQKWTYATGGELKSSPAVASNGTIYVGSDDTYLYALNTNGTLKWRYKCSSAIQTSPAVDSSGVVYVTCSNGSVVALNSNGTLKWQYTVSAQIASSPAIGPTGMIYFGAEDSRLYALTSSGALAWTYQTTGPVRSSPAVGNNGVMYVGSEDGRIYAIKPDGSALWSANLGGAVTSSPAIGSDGTLVVGAGDQKLHTFPPDSTPPSTPIVTDDGTYSTAEGSLSASWESFDDESGISESHYAIGTTPGGADVLDWTSAGTALSMTHSGLSLEDGSTYFIAVKTRNGAGLWSEVGVSDGIIVDASPASTPLVVDDGDYTSNVSSLHAVWSSSDPHTGVAEYQYAIGTAAGSTNVVDWTSVGTDTEVTRSGLTLEDGTKYFFSVKAKNGAGMWSAVGSSDGITVDSSPPAAPTVNDDGDFTSSLTTLKANWSASDPHSGIAEYQYAIGTSTGATDVVDWTSTGATSSVTKTGLTLETGKTYFFSVKARNGAGLWGPVGSSDGILCDGTPPSTPVVIDDGAYTSSTNTLHASWLSSDAESGVVSYQYAIGSTAGGTNIVNWTSVGAATEVTRSNLSLIQGSTYYISVKATNGAGIVSAVGTSDGITVDSSPPTTPAVTDDGVYSTSSTTLHAIWSAADTQSGIAEYQYAIGTSIGSNNVVDWTSVGTDTEVTKSGLTLVDGTKYFFSVKAKNGAGMWSAVGSSDGITVDSSPPAAPTVNDDGDFTSSLTTLKANWSASDPHSGIAEYQYAIGTSAGATDIVDWTSTGATSSVTKTGLTLETGKTYFFSVKARNGAGLWGPVGSSDGILCDGTPPSTPVVVDDGAYTSSTNTLHATWSSSDSESGVVSYQYAIGSTPGSANTVSWTNIGSATEVTRTGLVLAQGSTYYISVKATNGAGLISAVGTSDGITVDSSPPTTPTVTDDGVYSTSSTTLHAIWSAADTQSGIAEYQYAIGTSAGSTNVVDWTSVGTDTEVTKSDLALVDGTKYFFTVKARNGAGMWSAVGSSDGITVDSSPPAAPTVNDDGEYTSSLTTLKANWSASDPHSGIAEYQYAIGTSAGATDVVDWTSTGATSSITKTGLTLETGKTYFFSVKARNGAGLWGSVGSSDGILCDSTPPSTPVVTDDGAYTSSTNTLHATWSSSDSESGVVSYQYAIGSTPGSTNTVSWTNIGSATEVTRTGLVLAQGSTYYISVKATNGAGLISAVGSSDGITVDSSPPTTPVVTDDGVYSTSSTTLHAIWNSADTQSGVAEYQYAIGTAAGSTNVVDWTSVGTDTEVTKSDLALVDGTKYFFSVKARNGAGMWSAVGSSDGITVDSSPPAAPTVNDDGEYTSSLTTLKANWSVSDPHSGIAEYQYAIGTSAGATDVVDWTSTGATASVTKTGLTLETGKTYFFSVKARNGAGLWGPVGSSDGILCDGTPPSTPVVIDDGAYTSSTNTLHATWSSSDSESGIVSYQYAIGSTAGGTNIVNWTSVGAATEVTRTNLSLVQGSTYYISVKATNGAGLVSAVGTSDGITVDSSPPTTPVVTDDGVYSTSSTTLHAIWSASDTQSGVAEYQYAIGTSAGGTNVVDWTSVGTNTEVTKSGLALEDGTKYFFSVKAKNGAGMWSAVGSSDGITVDSSPPAAPSVNDDGDFTSSLTTLKANWSASDPYSGIAEYQYAIGTSAGATDVVDWTSTGATASVTKTGLTLETGKTYFFSVKARNGAGLWGPVGNSDGILCDGTPPSTPVVIDDGAYTSSTNTLHASWLSSDSESGIVSYQYAIGSTAGGTNIVNWTSVGGATEVTRTGLVLAQGSTYYISVKATNGAGLISAVGSSDGITVDSSPPTTPTVTDDGVYSTSSTTLHAIWSAADTQSGIAEYQYAIGTAAGSTNVVDWTSVGTDTEVTKSDLALVDGTKYFFSVKARNGAGMWSAVGSSDGIFVDASPPTTPIVVDDGNYTTIPNVLNASWSADDPHTGVVEYQYAVGTSSGGTDVINWTSAGTQTSVSLNDIELLPGALYFFAVRARNGAGLWSEVGVSDGIGIDQTPPGAPEVIDEGEYTSSLTSLSARWLAIDPESGISDYEYCIGTIPGGTDIVGWTSSDGASHITHTGLNLTLDVTYYFTVRAMNGVGMWGPSGTSDGIVVRIMTTWPKFRNNAQNEGSSQFIGPTVPGILSQFHTDWGIVSSPAVAGDGTLYFGTDEGYLYCVGPNGILHWRYKTDGPIDSSPALGPNGAVVFGSYDHYIYCLTADGALRWKYKTGAWNRSSPVIGPDNTVYIGAQDGYFYAIRWDGKLKWKYFLNNTAWSSPALSHDGSRVYFGGGDGGIYCLDTGSGEAIWRKMTGTAVDSSPCVAPDGTIYMGSGDGYFYALNPDGSQKWALWTGDLMDSSAAIGPSGTIYVGSGDDWSAGLLYAVNPDGSVKWTFDSNGSIRSSPAVDAAEVVYFGSTDNHLYAVNSAGVMKWDYRTDGPLYSSPAIGRGGTISVGTSLGTMLTLGDASNDITPPSVPIVTRSFASTFDTTSLSASWIASDAESGISEYMFAIGTLPGSDDISPWESCGQSESILKTGLQLSVGQTYYFCVKARNGAGKWGAVGVSEGIRVVSVGDGISIGIARQTALAQSVYLPAKIVSAVFEDCLYIQEPGGYAGIKVIYGATEPPAEGAKINLMAWTIMDGPEAALALQSYIIEGEPSIPKALGLSNSAIARNADAAGGVCSTGLLATVWGKVNAVGDDHLYIDDGSGIVDASRVCGIKIRTHGQDLTVGDYIRVTGVVSVEQTETSNGKLIRPRNEADIITLSASARANTSINTD